MKKVTMLLVTVLLVFGAGQAVASELPALVKLKSLLADIPAFSIERLVVNPGMQKTLMSPSFNVGDSIDRTPYFANLLNRLKTESYDQGLYNQLMRDAASLYNQAYRTGFLGDQEEAAASRLLHLINNFVGSIGKAGSTMAKSMSPATILPESMAVLIKLKALLTANTYADFLQRTQNVFKDGFASETLAKELMTKELDKDLLRVPYIAEQIDSLYESAEFARLSNFKKNMSELQPLYAELYKALTNYQPVTEEIAEKAKQLYSKISNTVQI